MKIYLKSGNRRKNIISKLNRFLKGSRIMNDFYTVLNYVNKIIYEPSGLIVKSVHEEKQNSKYGAGTFQLDSKTVRFRVANITPTKVGQFVAF